MEDQLEASQKQIEDLNKRKIAISQEGIKKIEDLDRKITSIQNSTRTTILIFAHLHNYFRMKYKWYYSWHLKSQANFVHIVILIIYLILFYIKLINR